MAPLSSTGDVNNASRRRKEHQKPTAEGGTHSRYVRTSTWPYRGMRHLQHVELAGDLEQRAFEVAIVVKQVDVTVHVSVCGSNVGGILRRRQETGNACRGDERTLTCSSRSPSDCCV